MGPQGPFHPPQPSWQSPAASGGVSPAGRQKVWHQELSLTFLVEVSMGQGGGTMSLLLKHQD